MSRVGVMMHPQQVRASRATNPGAVVFAAALTKSASAAAEVPVE
jgi:hypothetical protein